MNEFMKQRYDKLGPVVVKALEKRNFAAYYCADREAALEKALSLIPADAVIGYGGSLTQDDTGIKAALSARGNRVLHRDGAADPAARAAIDHQALASDWFLMGSNAITEDGQLVNIDGAGNRVAALAFGPGHVLVVAGMNKVVKTLGDAYDRARYIAAPANMMRFGLQTPCAATGACDDCNSAGCICNQFLITRRCNPPGRIHVILIGEELGL